MQQRSSSPSSAASRCGTDPLFGRLFGVVVIQPLRVAHAVLGDRIWPPLEWTAALIGKVGGRLTRRVFTRPGAEEHPLQPLLRFTDFVEGSLGIRGDNELGDDGTASRRVTYCPFADQLTTTTGFCTRLGHVAGCEAFRELVPGSDFDVLRTLSQGDSCCEYRYYASR